MKALYVNDGKNLIFQEAKYLELYAFFIENRNLSYNKFMEKLKNKLRVKVSCFYLREKIEYVRFNISSIYAKNMEIILNYLIAQKEKNTEKIIDLYPYIKNMSKPAPKRVEPEKSTSVISLNNKKNEELLNNSIDKIKNIINMVISSEKSLKQLYEEGKIETYDFRYNINILLKYIDPEDYIKFIKINYNLNELSLKELDEFIEIIEYYCNNINNNINRFESKDEDILFFPVKGEDKLGENFKSSQNNVRNWKMKRLKILSERYSKLKEVLVSFRDDMSLDKVIILGTVYNKFYKEDEPFVYEYYNSLVELSRKYKDICKLKTVTDEKRDKIKEEYISQLVLRNN